jgi:mono/diheme cytochrome c family protein
MLQAILEGSRTAATDRMPTAPSMPAYDWKLSDAQIAAVATYIRNAWGNRASAVTAEDVGKLRAKKGD